MGHSHGSPSASAMPSGSWHQRRYRPVRRTMLLGSTVFGLSAIGLLAFPALFGQWLGIRGSAPTAGSLVASVDWSMRMVGVVLVPLAVAMNVVARRCKPGDLRLVAAMLMLGSAALAWLTYMAPGEPTMFRWLYVGIGALFALAYLVGLLRR
jgi:hypothetical protein